MSIEAINEQFLRTIGVAITIARSNDLSVVYNNTAFTDWFGDIEDRSLVDVIPDLTTEDIERVTHGGERFAGKVRSKRKRRNLVIAI